MEARGPPAWRTKKKIGSTFFVRGEAAQTFFFHLTPVYEGS
jgi:hypothetical protein